MVTVTPRPSLSGGPPKVFLGSLDKNHRQCLGFRNSASRLRPRVHFETDNSKIQVNEINFGQSGPYPSGSKYTQSQESARTSTSRGTRTGILQHLFPTTKENGGSQVYFKPSSSKQAFSKNNFQNGHVQYSKEIVKNQLVGHIYGPSGRIPTCTSETVTQEISPVRSRQRIPRTIPSTLFRTQDSSSRVHQDSIRNRSSSTTSGYSYFSIPRRLVNNSPKSSNLMPTTTGGFRVNCTTRFHNKQGQISSQPQTIVRVSGSTYRSNREYFKTIDRKNRETETRGIRHHKSQPNQSSSISRGFRHDEFLYRSNTQSSSPHATYSAPPAEPLETVKSRFKCLRTSHRGSKTTPEMVAHKPESSKRSATGKSDGRTVSCNRRQLDRLGRALRRTGSPGKMGLGITKEAHKYARTRSSLAMSQSFRNTRASQKHSDQNRQLYSRVIHQQRGRNALARTMYEDVAPASMVRRQRHKNQSITSSGHRKQTGRPSIEETNSSLGVEAKQYSSRTTFPQMGKTAYRPLRQQGKSPTSNILFLDTRSRNVSSRRNGYELEPHASVRLSTNYADWQDTTENTEREMSNHSHSTELAQENLVSDSPGMSPRPPSPSSRESRSSISAEEQNLAPGTAGFSTGSMAVNRHTRTETNLSKMAKKLLKRAVRGSTRKVYKSRFQKFSRWCKKKGEDPLSAPINVVANFLASLYKRTGDRQLSYSTIAGYRSAISAFHFPIDNRRLGNCETISRLVKGVFNNRPPARKLIPAWNIQSVLNLLRTKPFEPFMEVPLKYATWKVTMLLALATASRCSDMSKLSYKEPFYSYHPESGDIRLIPTSLKKQCRMGHFMQQIRIVKFNTDRLLDPVRAVKLYLKRVKSLRGQSDSLLITYGGTNDKPSTNTIARWLKCVISRVEGVDPREARAHSTRSVSTSWAAAKGVTLKNIMEAADWSSESTFARHYLSELAADRQQFQHAVLGQGDQN